uniref:Uncharacterized protein n=1 Tax=Arundo donax TaxID=35708 RepID=A0A0A8ZN04_ARUDO
MSTTFNCVRATHDKCENVYFICHFLLLWPCASQDGALHTPVLLKRLEPAILNRTFPCSTICQVEAVYILFYFNFCHYH